MQIKFDVFWKKSLGTLYKDNSITVLGKEANVGLDLNEVYNIYVNFKVEGESFTYLVEIVDVETKLIRIPFKIDVIKEGTHEFELVANMKNGDVLPSQTYSYKVDKSLENRNSIEIETNYPILIQLLRDVGNKMNDIDEATEKLDEFKEIVGSLGEFKEIANVLDKIGDIEGELIEVGDKFDDIESNYAKKTDIPLIPTKISQLINDKNYLTSIPNEYITETELESKGYLTKHQDISGKADKTELHNHTNKTVLDGITSAKVQSWDSKSTFSGNYSDLSNKPTIPTVTNDLTNTLKTNYDKAYTHSQSTHAPSNAQKNSDITKAEIEAKLIGNVTSHTHSQYLTQHQDLSLYPKTNELSLGVHTDGMIYLFKDGQPIGSGISQNIQSGDVVGYIDNDNNIILTGLLPNGAYKMKYQYEDGTFSSVIDVTIGDVETYKNLLPEAQEEGLTGVYNGVGYKENIRWSGSSNAFISGTQCVLTGLIPIREYGDVFHVRGVDIVGYVNGRQSGWSHYYDENGDKLQMAVSVPATVIGTDVNGDFTITLNPSIMTSIPNDAVYVRFQFGQIVGDELIVSRNFLIP